ncbi:hypothetical protein D3C87_1541280 [compost metagenome]
MLEHDDLREVVDQLVDHRHRRVHTGRLRKVLQADRDLGAEQLRHVGVVVVDLFVCLQVGHGRQHDAGGTLVHGGFRQALHVPVRRVAHTHHHRCARADAPQHTVHHGQRFRFGELGRLAHHAEDGEARDALLQVEVGQAVGAFQVQFTTVGEGCRGNDVDAFRRLADLGWGHEDSLG